MSSTTDTTKENAKLTTTSRRRFHLTADDPAFYDWAPASRRRVFSQPASPKVIGGSLLLMIALGTAALMWMRGECAPASLERSGGGPKQTSAPR
jgi:hypothetical protein